MSKLFMRLAVFKSFFSHVKVVCVPASGPKRPIDIRIQTLPNGLFTTLAAAITHLGQVSIVVAALMDKQTAISRVVAPLCMFGLAECLRIHMRGFSSLELLHCFVPAITNTEDFFWNSTHFLLKFLMSEQ